MRPISLAFAAVALLAFAHAQSAEQVSPMADIDFRFDVKIPMRDGIQLSGIVYAPKNPPAPVPCMFSLNPYIASEAHFRGAYFSRHGVTYVSVDSRGRGNSEGEFRPFIQEAKDGHDVVEWLGKQPFCNGRFGMWGGSYLGYVQWAIAKERPAALGAIMPIASGYPGLDFPMRYNIQSPYPLQWLLYTAGNASQQQTFADAGFWAPKYRAAFESGAAFKDFDRLFGMPSGIFQEWTAHPYLDAYWDEYVPSAAQYAQLTLPILTVTGSHDGDQAGALTYYRSHMKNAPPEEQARHYLIIGPWDHAGTVAPRREFGGLKLGPASLLDMPRLAVDWYLWNLSNGPKPEFLQKRVAYYVMGADKWRYADTLEGITAQSQAYYLDSTRNPVDAFASGSLATDAPGRGRADSYVFDPRDMRKALSDTTGGGPSDGITQQRSVFTSSGNQLIYHSSVFDRDTQISGFFKLTAWIAIDQPDTDISAAVYEIDENGDSTLLTSERLRARYRESLREPKLVRTTQALRYEFQRFDFVSRQIRKGSRLRLVIGPLDSIYSQRNYNTGGVVAEATLKEARTVRVMLYHDRSRPSALYVPLGHPESAAEPKAPGSALIQTPGG